MSNPDAFGVAGSKQDLSSPQQPSQLEMLSKMQAVMALQNEQQRRFSAGNMQGLSGMINNNGIGMMSWQQRAALEQQKTQMEKIALQAQIELLERSHKHRLSTDMNRVGSLFSPQGPDNNINNNGTKEATNTSDSPAKKRRMLSKDLTDALNVASTSPGGGPSAVYGFPLPPENESTKHTTSSKLDTFREAWGILTRRSNNVDYMMPSDRTYHIKEAFGRAIQFQNIKYYTTKR